MRVWVDPKTREKINILGSKYPKELLKVIDEENLPEFLGGKFTCGDGECLRKNRGPWNPEVKKIFGVPYDGPDAK